MRIIAQLLVVRNKTSGESMKLAGISRPVAFTRNEISLYLQRILQLTDWAPSRLAAEAGLAPSTINRFLTDPNGPLLSATTMGKIETATYNRMMERVRAGELNPDDMWQTHAGRTVRASLPEMNASGQPSGIEWGMPEGWLRFNIGGEPGACLLFAVDSRDLEPFLYVGDRVFIDTTQRAVVPGAIYAVADSKGRWVLREKPRKNTKMIGRVIGMFRRT